MVAHARDAFADELRGLGFDPELLGADRVAYPLVPEHGRLAGSDLRVGLQVPPDWRRTPPSGPHLQTAALPISPNGEHPNRVHASDPFGPGWVYLSRPFPEGWRGDWPVEKYLAYVARLIDTL